MALRKRQAVYAVLPSVGECPDDPRVICFDAYIGFDPNNLKAARGRSVKVPLTRSKAYDLMLQLKIAIDRHDELAAIDAKYGVDA